MSLTYGFKSRLPHQKETTIFDKKVVASFCSLHFALFVFSLLSNCRSQIKDKREEIKEKVALLRKALNEGTNYDIIHFDGSIMSSQLFE